MDFKTIDKSNYRECMELQVEESQKYFVADNTRSLVEAAYEDGLYTLGVYDGDTMVGFVLYDYDDTYPGWSMSRFAASSPTKSCLSGSKCSVRFSRRAQAPMFTSVELR